MWALLKMALNAVISNTIVRTVALKTILDLQTFGAEIIPAAIELIKEASTKDISNLERTIFVRNGLKDKYPHIASSVLNKLIENAYDAWRENQL